MKDDDLPTDFEVYPVYLEPSFSGEPIQIIESFSEPRIQYEVNLQEQTCTCPDFQEGRKNLLDVNNFGRWCKHLITGLERNGALDDLDDWQSALLLHGYGGPIAAFKVFLPTARPVILTLGLNKNWLNIYARRARPGENITNASGKINQYGWNIGEQRWAYGVSAPGASELRPILKNLTSIEYIQADVSSVRLTFQQSHSIPTKNQNKLTEGCLMIIGLFAIFFLFSLT